MWEDPSGCAAGIQWLSAVETKRCDGKEFITVNAYMKGLGVEWLVTASFDVAFYRSACISAVRRAEVIMHVLREIKIIGVEQSEFVIFATKEL